MKDEIKRVDLVYVLQCFAHVFSSKIDAELFFLHFLAIFALFKFTKGLIFGIFILDLPPKWLLDAFNINGIYFEQKRFIFI